MCYVCTLCTLVGLDASPLNDLILKSFLNFGYGGGMTRFALVGFRGRPARGETQKAFSFQSSVF